MVGACISGKETVLAAQELKKKSSTDTSPENNKLLLLIWSISTWLHQKVYCNYFSTCHQVVLQYISK